MGMYFKLPIEAPAAKKINELFEKRKQFHEKFSKIAEKYDWKDCYRTTFDLFGIACVLFKDGAVIDTDIYKKDGFGYVLKKRVPKEKKAMHEKILADWRSLSELSIPRNEVDKCLGKISNSWNWAGVCKACIMKNEYILVEINNPEEYHLPDEIIEIKYSEYQKLRENE